jgi:TPR repeat protein
VSFYLRSSLVVVVVVGITAVVVVAHQEEKDSAKDIKETYKLYRMAVEQSNPFGQYFLGKSYQDGRGVRQNEYEAVHYFNSLL